MSVRAKAIIAILIISAFILLILLGAAVQKVETGAFLAGMVAGIGVHVAQVKDFQMRQGREKHG